MAPLLAWRGAYRLVIAASNPLLAAAWGAQQFAQYAAVMGAYTVVSFLTSLGVEKSALKLIPRAQRIGPQLLAIFVAIPAVLGAGCLGWVAVTATGALALAGGALAIGLGVNQVLVALHRVQDRPGLDVANHAMLMAGIAATTLAAVLAGLGPVGLVGWTVLLVTGLNLALLTALAPQRFRAPRRAAIRATLGTSVLMSASEVAAAAIVSLVFVVLVRSPYRDEAGTLYLAIGISSLLVKAFGYLLRLAQPRVSLTLHRGRAAAEARARTDAATRLLAAGGLPYLAVVTALFVLAQRVGAWPPVVCLLLLYLATAPLVFGMGTINFLLENAGRAALQRTALGSIVGLAVAAPAAYLLITGFGAGGGLSAIALAEIAHAAAVTPSSERTP
jgi:hypothetical protein